MAEITYPKIGNKVVAKVLEMQNDCTIGMKLRCDSNGSGRPEQVMLALGFAQTPQSIHRRRLILGRS